MKLEQIHWRRKSLLLMKMSSLWSWLHSTRSKIHCESVPLKHSLKDKERDRDTTIEQALPFSCFAKSHAPLPRVMQSPQTEFRFVPCVLSHFSCVWLFATPWTVACQIPLSMGFSRREYWNALLHGMPCPSPKDPPDPGTEPSSLWSPALADRFFIISTTWEAQSWGLDLMITQRTQRAFPHFSLEALSVH